MRWSPQWTRGPVHPQILPRSLGFRASRLKHKMPRRHPLLIVAATRRANARQIVADQRALITRRQVAGRPTVEAEKTLQSYESSLRYLEEHTSASSERNFAEGARVTIQCKLYAKKKPRRTCTPGQEGIRLLPTPAGNLDHGRVGRQQSTLTPKPTRSRAQRAVQRVAWSCVCSNCNAVETEGSRRKLSHCRAPSRMNAGKILQIVTNLAARPLELQPFLKKQPAKVNCEGVGAGTAPPEHPGVLAADRSKQEHRVVPRSRRRPANVLVLPESDHGQKTWAAAESRRARQVIL
jgi:hypothetical protein